MPDEAKSCPACDGRLFPRELECADCGLHVRTAYRRNEFAELDDELLHVLRIFVACEGRIRDMEAALGVSYPTVKSRLAKLRETLGFDRSGRDAGSTASATAPTPGPDSAKTERSNGPDTVKAILDQLEAGEIDYDEAMRAIRRRR